MTEVHGLCHASRVTHNGIGRLSWGPWWLLGKLGSRQILIFPGVSYPAGVNSTECPLRPQACDAMSQASPAASSSTNFATIFTAALEDYKKKTKNDITSHPLASQLQACDSPAAVLSVLRDQVQALEQSQSADDNFTKWLDPTVNVLYAFSTTLGNSVGLVSPRHQPAQDRRTDLCEYRYFHPRTPFSLGSASSFK